MAAVTIKVDGLREVNRALNKVNRGAAKSVRDGLKKAGDPVRVRAETLAAREIRNLSGSWGAMRIGARSDSIFLAPKTRRRGGSPRPNLGGLLINRAMWPAAIDRRGEVEEALEDALDRLGRSAGF